MKRLTFLITLVALLALTACDLIPAFLSAPQQAFEPAPETLVMGTFQVRLPATLPPGDTVYLAEVDEVTGLAFNQTLHPMEAVDPLNFVLILPVKQNMLFKYRYVRKGDYAVSEHTPTGEIVRYRSFFASNPRVVQDIVYRWTDSSPQQTSGRITGKAVQWGSELPIQDLIVSAGGMQTRTFSDGSFVLEGLPEGTHNLTAFAADGRYEVFQQDATVVNGAATGAQIKLQLANMVDVTFRLQVPAQTPPGVTIRIAGSLSQLGNSFASLRGDTSNTSIRLPGLHRSENGAYNLTVSLPAGSVVHYKYTLGDGTWNAEHDAEGNFVIREIVVPNVVTAVNDQVVRWNDSDQKRITFDVTVPGDRAENEIVSIQFNPGYDWMEPIPMWLVEPNRWVYSLYSPLRGLDELQYRYCRDLQCGSADDAITPGNLAAGRKIGIEYQPQIVTDQVDAWIWMDQKLESVVVPNIAIQPRGVDFIAGIALQDAFDPSWLFRLSAASADILETHANWIVAQPSMTFTNSQNPLQAIDPGQDLFGPDLSVFLAYFKNQGLGTAVFPRSHYPEPVEDWWQEAPKTFPWWVSWFTYYQSFIQHYAILASQTNVSAVILGDPSISPSLPGGFLSDGTPSGVPEDANSRWRKIIQTTRDHFAGEIWWALEGQPDKNNAVKFNPPPLLDAIDALYIVWNVPIAPNSEQDVNKLSQSIGKQLDQSLLPMVERLKIPAILAIEYPSALGAAAGCLPGMEGECIDFGLLNRPNPDLQNISRDLGEQERIYNAIFLAVNDRPWINGVVSHGYYLPVPLQDKSTSIHGKPAQNVLWFWFGKFLGVFEE